MKYLSKHLVAGLFLELLVVVLSYVDANGNALHFFQAAARLCGRISLLYFIFLFVHATLNSSMNDENVVKTKYILARNLAIIHVIHWIFLATAVRLSGFELVPVRLAGGAFAYVLIVIYPFLLQRKTLSRHLGWMQHVFLNYVWLIFLITYLTRVSGKAIHVTGESVTYLVFLIVMVALMAWRLIVLTQISRSNFLQR